MNEKNDPGHDKRSTSDAWEDRLIDRSLHELLGNERPPDLSDKILAAANEPPQVQTQRKEREMSESKGITRRLFALATVACLMIGIGIGLLLPAVQSARPLARNEQSLNNRAELSVRDVDTSDPAESTEESLEEWIERTTPSDPSERSIDFDYDSDMDIGIVSDKESDPSLTIDMGPPDLESSDIPEERELIGRIGTITGQPLSGRASGKRDPVERSRTSAPEGKDFGLPTTEFDTVNQPVNETKTQPGAKPVRVQSSDGTVRYLADNDIPEVERPYSLLTITPKISVDGVNGPNNTLHESELFGIESGEGKGPGHGGDQYTRVVDNSFRKVSDQPLSTFSIDVDTASYANVRRFLLAERRLPPPDAVRIEEMINYFDYEYPGPNDDVPFASHIEVAGCPWQPKHRLVRVGLKGKEIRKKQRPECNLVFLLDVSGSMDSQDKLGLLKEGMKLLAGKLRPNDRVAIVVYAGSEGLVLPSTPGDQQETIQQSLDRLTSGGSTNGGAGIELAYKIAQENMIEGGVNRVLLCTDGDFNVGTTSTADLERMVEERAKTGVFLSVLGFGRGNLNDAMMETISNKGNGNYAYIDSIREARKVLLEQLTGTLVTIAKDVKIQIEFNPTQVAAYRLIGYENRILAAEDFNDDKKDAGEIGAGHTVTALYQVVPAGVEVEGTSAETPTVDPLKYQKPTKPFESNEKDASTAGELLTLKLRYKQPDGDKSKLLEFPVPNDEKGFNQSSREMKFASAIASFGMLLRQSEHAGNATYDAVLEIATEAKGADPHGYRAELLDMVRTAKELSGK